MWGNITSKVNNNIFIIYSIRKIMTKNTTVKLIKQDFEFINKSPAKGKKILTI